MGASEIDDPDGFSEWCAAYLSDGRMLRGYFVAPDGNGAPDVGRFLSRWMQCPT